MSLNATSESWLTRYRIALDRALARADLAATGRDLLAFGLTNNVDLVAWLDEAVMAELLDGQSVDWRGKRETRADTVDQLLRAIVQYVSAGLGTDLQVAVPATQSWLMERLRGRLQLGGTGAQAANTMATLGFPSLIHLTGCSRAQADAFDVPQLLRVARAGESVPLAQAVNESDETMWHVALEYSAGFTFALDAETIVAPAASRVIVSYDPVNSDFEVDPVFVDMVADPANDVRKVLISGYSQIATVIALNRLVEQTVAAARRWNAGRRDMIVHAELGAMPNPSDLAGVVETIGLEVGSIGMNADELADLLDVWGIQLPDRPSGICSLIETVRARTLTRRVNVHTATHVVTLTEADPEIERDALMFGSLVASTRARVGTYPTWSDLEETLRVNEPHPRGLAVLADLGVPDGLDRRGNDTLVVVPAIEIPSPVATVGLGDSFTGALLAML